MLLRFLQKSFNLFLDAMEHQWLRYITNLLLNGAVVLLGWNLLSFLILSFLPASFYFTIYSVEPTKTEFLQYEKLVFATNGIWKRDVFTEREDTLRCPPIDFYNQSHTKGHQFPGKVVNEQFRYPGETPQESTECFIETTFIAKINYGIEKKQIVKSGKFLIK